MAMKILHLPFDRKELLQIFSNRCLGLEKVMTELSVRRELFESARYGWNVQAPQECRDVFSPLLS